MLVSFDLEKERFWQISEPKYDGLDDCVYELATLSGCLSAVANRLCGELEIFVVNEYEGQESWTKLYSFQTCLPREKWNWMKRNPLSFQSFTVMLIRFYEFYLS